MNINQKSEITEINLPVMDSPAAKWSYVSLLFSLFFFFPFISHWEQITAYQLVISAGVYSLFIALFLITLRHTGKQTYLPIAGIILVAAFGSSISAGCNALFGYATFLSSYYHQRGTAIRFLIFNLVAQVASAYSFDLIHVYYLGPSMAVTLSLFIYGRFSQKETLNYLNSRQKNQQIEQLAAIAERERIARDMHDLLGHTLSSLALKSELAEKLIDKDRTEEARKEIKEVATLARSTLSEIREAITGLKHQSFAHNIENMARQLSDLGFKVDSQIELPQLNPKTESCLNMLCKEGITNILRHSDGDSVSIEISHDNSSIQLTIKDNGKVNQITPGNGIEGIKSRAYELQGDFNLSIEQGVKLEISLPNSMAEPA